MIELRVLVLDDDMAPVTAHFLAALHLFSKEIQLRQLVGGVPSVVEFNLGPGQVRMTIDPHNGRDAVAVARKIEQQSGGHVCDLVLLDEDWDGDHQAGRNMLLRAVVKHVRASGSPAPIIALFTRFWQREATWRGYIDQVNDINKAGEFDDYIFDGLEKTDSARLNLLFRQAIHRRRTMSRLGEASP
jgi:hypothetical protein